MVSIISLLSLGPELPCDAISFPNFSAHLYFLCLYFHLLKNKPIK